MKDQLLYLIHIRECIERIESFTREGRETFMNSRLIQDAVIRNFEIIGEAIKRLSGEIRQSHPEIPWRRIAGFRDFLIHDYISVEPNEVWNIIEQDLPILKTQNEQIIEEVRAMEKGKGASR